MRDLKTDQALTVRLNKAQLKVLESQAKKTKRSMSFIIRELIDMQLLNK